MRFAESEIQWRDTLRKLKKPGPNLSSSCLKFQRYNVRASILSETDTKKKKNPFHPLQRCFTGSDITYQFQQDLSKNYSKFNKAHHELLHQYEVLIKQQQAELSSLAVENNLLEKQIAKFKSKNSFQDTRSSEGLNESEEKIINYYKSAIQVAENLLEKQKAEFKVRLAELTAKQSRSQQA